MSGPKKSSKRGGVKNSNTKPINIRPNNIPLARINTSGLGHRVKGRSVVSNLLNPRANARRNNIRPNNITLEITNTSGLLQRAYGQSVTAPLRNPRANNRRNNQKQNIVEFINTTNKALEEIYVPNQIPSIIQTINSILQNNISSLRGHANNRGNANKLTKQLNELQKKAEKRMKLLENKNEKNSEQNEMYPIINELLKSLHNSPQGINYAWSILPTAISGRKHTMPNLDSGLSINKLKNFLEYLKENPSVFKSENNTERKMITGNINQLISKIYQYYYTKFITNPKLQRLLKNRNFLRASPEESEKEIIKKIEENGVMLCFILNK